MFGRPAFILIPVLAAIAISACSATATVPTATPVAAAPTQAAAETPHVRAVPEAIQGNYTANIQGSTVSSGVWNMQITTSDIFAKNPLPGADMFAIGIVFIDNDHVTFQADAECTPGAPHREGAYTYALVNNELRFTVIDDLCLDRKNMLTAAPWERQV